jgi:hemolysin type calcium-binding protein
VRTMRATRAGPLLGALALVVAGAPTASAATAGVAATGGVVDYAAAPGEANALRASATGTTITLTDPGATIAVRTGCRAVDQHTATCTGTALSAALGDGADSATVTGALAAHLDGGAGADTLTGGTAGDAIDGGPGPDVLAGGAGADRISGDGPPLVVAGGDDRLAGGPGADVLTGDGGRDTADYTATPGASVSFDGRANDGAAGEGDNADAEVVARAPGDPGPVPLPAPQPAAAPPGLAAPTPLAVPAPAPLPGAAVAAVARGLRAPARITAATLRRRGIRVAVTCRPACRVRLDLTPADRRRPVLVRRAITAGPGTTAAILRPRPGTRLPRAGLAIRAAFAGGGAITRRVVVR